MGEVFLARMRTSESGFERLVVIKRILPHLTDKDEFVNMFLDEARVAAQIHHSNVCQILELGQVDGRYYMALEYLEGISMTQVIIGRRDYPELADLRLIISIMTQACEGLHFAHNVRTPDGALAGVVHRDVNPKNIFVTSAGVTKVLDFGIVKAKDALNVTRTGSVKGTYSYMSPEQIKAHEVDRRSDVFSLGIVAWEALTGVRLYKRENDFHTWRAITEEAAPPPSEFREGIPPALDQAVLRALSRDREDRWATARDFAVALEEGLGLGSLTPVKLAAAIETSFADEIEQQRARTKIVETDDVVSDDWGVPTTVELTPSAQRLIEAELEVGVPETFPDLEDSPPVDTGSFTSPSHSVLTETKKSRLGIWLALGMIAAIFTLAAVLFVTRQPDKAAGSAEQAADTATPRRGDSPGRETPPVVTADAAVAPATGVDAAAPAPADAAPAVDAAVAAAAIDAAPRTKPDKPKPDRNKPDRPRPDKPEEPKGFGTLTINAKPYGTVFIDGRRVGITPIVGHKLSAGRHRVKVISSVDKAVKSFSVRITPNKGTRRMVKW